MALSAKLKKALSRRHEDYVAKLYKGVRSPSSGAALLDQGDVSVKLQFNHHLVECKQQGHPGSPKRSTIMTHMEKIADEAWSEGKEPALALRYYWPDSPLANRDGYVDLEVRLLHDAAQRMMLSEYAQELMTKVAQHGSEGCWEWLGHINDNGYGVLSIGKQPFRAHRVFYEIFEDEIPKDLVLDHLCRNRSCVNPAHLEPVTIEENTRRGHTSRLDHLHPGQMHKTECKWGHPFDAENTYVRPDGKGRGCKICRQIANDRRSVRPDDQD